MMLGHSSIVLTADTYTSVLPDLAHHAAEATARLVLTSAGTTARAIRNGHHTSHKRPGETIAAPHHPATAINTALLSLTIPPQIRASQQKHEKRWWGRPAWIDITSCERLATGCHGLTSAPHEITRTRSRSTKVTEFAGQHLIDLVGRLGVEPRTQGLKVLCSAS